MDEISLFTFFQTGKKTEPAEISQRTRVCILCSLRKQKCRLKSTTTNGWRHFGQSEQRKSSALFPIQSEKSPDSGIFTCDPTKKCIMPSSRERHKGRIGRGHDLRLSSEPLGVLCSRPRDQKKGMNYAKVNLVQSRLPHPSTVPRQ